MAALLATLALLVPLAEAVGSLAVRGSRPGLVRRVALVAAVANLAVCLALAVVVIHAGAPTGLRGSAAGVPVSLDATGAALLATDAVLGVACVTFSRIVDNARSCFATMGLAQLGFAVAFLSDQLLWLWAGWALSAFSLSALMAEWGGGVMARRWQANILPVVLVVCVGGVGLALAAALLGVTTVPAGPPEGSGRASQLLVYGFLFASCAATMGLFPVHFWLSEAHRSLAAGPALMLDGGLFSLAFYVLVRIACVVAPAGYAAFAEPFALLSAATVVYGGLCLTVQTDLRRANAYCSICYAGMIGLALAADPVSGAAAALLLACGRMLASALFAIVVWIIRTRTQTVDARELSGIAATFPLVAGLMVIAVGGFVALPPASTFSGLLFTGAAILTGPAPVACLIALVAGYALMVVSLVRLALRVCVGAPSASVAAYVRHLEADPFDIIVAGQRVPVGLVAPDGADAGEMGDARGANGADEAGSPSRPQPAVELTGDLAGLADFELAEPSAHEAILIDHLHGGDRPLAATEVASAKAAEELDLIGELRGIGDKPLARPGDDVAEERAAGDSEWDALQELYLSVASHDDWADEDDVGDEADPGLRGAAATEACETDEGQSDGSPAADEPAEGPDEAALPGEGAKPDDDEDEAARRAREEAEEDAAWDALDDEDDEWDGMVVANPGLVVREASDDKDSAAPTPPESQGPTGPSPAPATSSLQSVLDQQSLLIDMRAYDQAATTSSRPGSWRGLRAEGAPGQASPLASAPASMSDGSPQQASGVARTDDELLDVMLENIVAIDRGAARRLDERDAPRRRHRHHRRLTRAEVGERPISPGDPEAHETLPDHTADASFRRSTLTWAEYMTCTLLVAASGGLGFAQGVLFDAARRVLEVALAGI